MVYLERRGKWFYYRTRIPHELQPCFGGKVELKVSLRSCRYDIAKRMVKRLSYSTEQLFTQLRRNLALLPEAQLKKLVADHFRQVLDDAEDARLRGGNLLPDHGEGDDDPLEGLKLHLTDLQEDLAMGKYSSIEHTAGAILAEAGLTSVAKDSPEYRRVCREILRAAVEATRTELGRLLGDYSSSPSAGDLVPAPAPAEAPSSAPSMPLSTLIEDHVKEMVGGKRWTSKTQAENESIYRVLVEAVGDVPVSTLNHKVMVQFRDTLTRLPSNMNKKPEYRGKSIPELLKLKAGKTLSTNTTNKYMNRVSSLLKWAAKRELIHQNYAEGLNISKRNSKDSEERDVYSTDELKKMLSAPMYTGTTIPRDHPERFWIPLIALFSGMRLNEICQLDVADIRKVDGIPCFDINDNGNGKRVKTAAGKRLVPVHPVLVELGLLKYAEGVKGEKLWPKLKLRRDGWGQGFSRYFQTFNRRYITDNPRQAFHSLRHTAGTALKHSEVDALIIAEILGHATRGELSRYGKGFPPRVLLEALLKMDLGIEGELKGLPRLA